MEGLGEEETQIGGRIEKTLVALADSLLTVLKGGADFAQVAAQYSVYDATAANGGEVGVMPFSAFSGEFAAAPPSRISLIFSVCDI